MLQTQENKVVGNLQTGFTDVEIPVSAITVRHFTLSSSGSSKFGFAMLGLDKGYKPRSRNIAVL